MKKIVGAALLALAAGLLTTLITAAPSEAVGYRTFHPAPHVAVTQINPSHVRIRNHTGHAIAVQTTHRQGGFSLTDTHYVCDNGIVTDDLWGRGLIVRVKMYRHPGAGC